MRRNVTAMATKQELQMYRNAKQYFKNIKGKYRLSAFFDMETFPIDRHRIETCMSRCEAAGIDCVIPRLPPDLEPSPGLLSEIADMYLLWIEVARTHGIRIGFHLHPVLEKAYYLHQPEEVARKTRTRILYRREYYCDPHERLHMPLHDGTLMALVAYDDEHAETIDLRSYVQNRVLSYTIPDGNWTVEEYLCTEDAIQDDPPNPMCNRLSPRHGTEFLETLFRLLGQPLTDELGKSIALFVVPDICFHAPNRRNWDEHFNQVFEERFGFDPAPFYPSLYHCIGETGPHIKSLLMACRADMLRSGAYASLQEFTTRHHVQLIASAAEPKLPACSWINGDILANGQVSACAVQEKAYLYGMNSTHLAASASDNFGNKYVFCELFRDYIRYNSLIACKDAMNAFGHGANALLVHFSEACLTAHPTLKEIRTGAYLTTAVKPTFCPFVSRVQSLLRGGSRINDIAILYPIYALHDKVYLYETRSEDFEYPNTPFTCNYMTVLNTISTYVGQDVSLLHPETVNTACHTENGILYLENAYQTRQFRVLILPGADMISLTSLRLVKKFYDEGGKVISAGELPRFAFEYSIADGDTRSPDDFTNLSEYGTENDMEVRDIIRHIFGADVLKPGVVRDFFHHRNSNGGESYYIGSDQTAADGAELCSYAAINDALQAFNLPLDIYMPYMPRFECRGAFNNSFREFVRLGLHDFIPGGGMISHIHKRRGTWDLYFFANSTERSYEEFIYLKGIHFPECWDPHSGRRMRLRSHFFRYNGAIYTRVLLSLPCNHAVFLIDRPMTPHLLQKKERIQASADTLTDITGDLNMMQHSNISRSDQRLD